MDFISTGTEILKQENVLTPRQKDIIDTEKEVLKFPCDWTSREKLHTLSQTGIRSDYAYCDKRVFIRANDE